ncbi:MAG: methylated-DNA--[protein]-cysteine S-methyltransferase [Caulobacteraceae bacterium]
MSCMSQYTLFETAAGWAGVVWDGQALIGVHLPEREPETARRALHRRFPQAAEATPPAWVGAAIGAIGALLQGEKVDLSEVPIDLARVPEFNARVFEIARRIPPGETRTYGEIAVELGDRLLARDVGAALGQNPWPIVVPCHRVTAAGGKLGGFSARGGADTKLKLLAIEGAQVAIQPAPSAKPGPKAVVDGQGSLF